jgi:hypothetical protein
LTNTAANGIAQIVQREFAEHISTNHAGKIALQYVGRLFAEHARPICEARLFFAQNFHKVMIRREPRRLNFGAKPLRSARTPPASAFSAFPPPRGVVFFNFRPIVGRKGNGRRERLRYLTDLFQRFIVFPFYARAADSPYIF